MAADHPAARALVAGRDVVLLVDNLRKSLPPSMGVLQRIMALEQVASELTSRWLAHGARARVCASAVVLGVSHARVLCAPSRTPHHAMV
jgi:hypothetical protein